MRVNPMHYPKHIGIIPDGNRTRAKQQGYETIQGHLEGVATSKKLIKYTFSQTEVQTLTIRGLSTENTKKRGQEEVSYLMKIFIDYVLDEEVNDFLRKNKINYRRIGSPIGIDPELVEKLQDKTKEHTYIDSNRTLCIAINYGGRDEIIRAIHEYNKDGHSINELSEEKIEHYLDTHNLPPLDLVIRTKAHMAHRLSGFMARQSTYAELYFSDKFFPDFQVESLEKALYRFNDVATHRNFGK